MTPTPEQLENRRKWVEALRRFKGKQCTEGGYFPDFNPRKGCCAIGKAALLFRCVQLDIWDSVRGRCGMMENEMASICHWNDDDRLDFPTIANRIEELWIKPYEGKL